MAGLEGKSLNHYELRKLVGRGGMADVYESVDLENRQEVAVKVFKREDEEMLQRFIREARLMRSLHNPHLVPVIDSGTCQLDGMTCYYIVMPFLSGGTLRSRIRRRGGLPLEEVCGDLRDIASALDYIHSQGIIHRDIKASNVLIGADGRCYLSDFGIARRTADATQLTSTGNVLGTVDYVAPELFETNRKADALSDLYSLGVLLYEMVTGQLPFTAENQIALVTMHMTKRPPSPRSIAPHVPAQVERVMMKALEKKPEQRYGSATELANAFCRTVTSSKNGVKSTLTAAEEQAPLVLPPLEPLQPAPVQGQHEVSPYYDYQDYQTVAVPEQFPAGRAGATPSMPAAAHSSPPLAPVRSPAYPASVPGRTRRSRSSHKDRSRGVIIAVLALVTILALTGLSFLALNYHPSPGPDVGATQTASAQSATTSPAVTPSPTPNLTATARAVAAMTATAQAQATQTAIARVTATAQAQASATAGVIQTATAGTPSYQDPLNDANSPTTQAANWSGANNSDGHCQFLSNGYQVTENNSVHGCSEQAYTYGNATITVDMNILSGDSGGLFFRVNTNLFGAYAGYLFQVNSKGQYKIWRSSNYSFDNDVQVFTDWTTSPALKTGYNVKNTLEVIMNGSTMLFYANGVYLTQVQDSTYTSGIVALGAFSTGTTTEVVYSNIKIYPIS
jgi:serine/threonine protein kinase